MKKWVGAALAASAIGGVAVAQQRVQLPAECRQKLVEQCGVGRDRDCVRHAMRNLTDDCRKAIS